MKRGRSRGLRSVLLAICLLGAATMAGCIGDDGAFTQEGDDGEPATAPGCERDTVEGTVSPLEDVSVEIEAGGEPAGADITVSATGASGGLVLSLEQAGQTVWEDETTGVGFLEISNSVTGLGTGPVVLAASTDSGTYQVELSLQVAWQGGTC